MNNSGQAYWKKPGTLVPALLLVVVSLLAPCSLRKSIQANLGQPVSKQHNPSKAIIQAEQTCSSFSETAPIPQSRNFPGAYAPFFLAPASEVFACLRETVARIFPNVPALVVILRKVPKYILYKQMKYWI